MQMLTRIVNPNLRIILNGFLIRQIIIKRTVIWHSGYICKSLRFMLILTGPLGNLPFPCSQHTHTQALTLMYIHKLPISYSHLSTHNTTYLTRPISYSHSSTYTNYLSLTHTQVPTQSIYISHKLKYPQNFLSLTHTQVTT